MPERVYAARGPTPFARGCGDGPTFVWDEVRRAQVRAQSDGLYAHPCGLNRGDFASVPDPVPIVRRKGGTAHGEYRT